MPERLDCLDAALPLRQSRQRAPLRDQAEEQR